MFQLLGTKQTLACAIKLKWDVAKFTVVRKHTARTSGISKVVKSQTMMTVKMRVTLMMNVNKEVMKNGNNLNGKLLFKLTTFLCNFPVNLVTKVTSVSMFC